MTSDEPAGQCTYQRARAQHTELRARNGLGAGRPCSRLPHRGDSPLSPASRIFANRGQTFCIRGLEPCWSCLFVRPIYRAKAMSLCSYVGVAEIIEYIAVVFSRLSSKRSKLQLVSITIKPTTNALESHPHKTKCSQAPSSLASDSQP